MGGILESLSKANEFLFCSFHITFVVWIARAGKQRHTNMSGQMSSCPDTVLLTWGCQDGPDVK